MRNRFPPPQKALEKLLISAHRPLKREDLVSRLDELTKSVLACLMKDLSMSILDCSVRSSK